MIIRVSTLTLVFVITQSVHGTKCPIVEVSPTAGAAAGRYKVTADYLDTPVYKQEDGERYEAFLKILHKYCLNIL